MVGQKNPVAAVIFSALRKKLMTGMAGGSLQRLRLRFHPLPHIDPPAFAWQSELFRKPSDKTRVFRGCPAPQLVIEMTNDQITETRSHQQVQQRHRIRPTRNPDKPALRTRSTSEPRDFRFRVHGFFDFTTSSSSPLNWENALSVVII